MSCAINNLFVKSGAVFSNDGVYRYQLWRIWEEEKPLVLWIMLNPSSATAEKNDPTVERCQRYAQQWGYGGLYVCNLFAFRATDPMDLYGCADPVGPQNNAAILATAAKAGLVVCGWGEHGRYQHRARAVEELLQRHGVQLSCLRLTRRGLPGHPLYLPKTLRATPYAPQRKEIHGEQ